MYIKIYLFTVIGDISLQVYPFDCIDVSIMYFGHIYIEKKEQNEYCIK